MRIGICGSNSVGKTTILKALQEDPMFEGVEFVEELTRTIGKNFPINNTAQDYSNTQLLITGQHLANLAKENFVVDRCLVDGFVFTDYFWLKGKCSIGARDLAHTALQQGIKLYDHVFYIPIETAVQLEDDGVRSTDVEFRKNIDHKMKMLVSTLRLENGCQHIHTVTGTVEERVKKIKTIIKNGR